MRMLMKVSIPVEAGNKAIQDGSLPRTIEAVSRELKPEATYFTTECGRRTMFMFFDMKDSSQIPAAAEPFFMAFNAAVDWAPVMNGEDLKKGIERAAKSF